MRTILARIFLVVASTCALAAAPKSAPIELVVGTYRDGSNVTEPKPAQSQYFKTQLGAFQIIQDFAGYKWFVDVIKRPEKRLYTRSIIENPADPKKPFVYEGDIDASTPSTTITHGPAMGLKIYQDYTVELIAYSDKKRTKEVDRLTQKIRSYVDTTGPELKIFDRLKAKSADGVQEPSAPPTSDSKP